MLPSWTMPYHSWPFLHDPRRIGMSHISYLWTPSLSAFGHFPFMDTWLLALVSFSLFLLFCLLVILFHMPLTTSIKALHLVTVKQ